MWKALKYAVLAGALFALAPQAQAATPADPTTTGNRTGQKGAASSASERPAASTGTREGLGGLSASIA